MTNNILILCDNSVYHAVIVSTQDQKEAYLQNGFTLYGGGVDENGLPTNSNWCREQLGLPPLQGPTGCPPNDMLCEDTQGKVLTPTGCYLAEQTPLNECFEKTLSQQVEQPKELPRTGASFNWQMPFVLTMLAVIMFVLFINRRRPK